MSFFKWSQTAASNSSADGSINWAEGQAPSSVNDSARAMMAAAAKYRDDIAGAITTGGTSTAYTVASYQSFDTLAHLNGQMIAFTPHATNTNAVGVDCTLNVDGLGACAIRFQRTTPMPNGSLILGTPYVVTYNNSDQVFYVQGGATNPYQIPVAGGMPFFASTAPNSSFAFPYGQAISRSTYAVLFGLVSTAYGSGDGSTTFNLPDLRGRVLAGLDNMGGSNAARLSSVISSTTLGAVGGEQTHALSSGELAAHTHTGVTGNDSPTHAHNYTAPNAANDTAITAVSGGTSTAKFWTGSAVNVTNNENANHTHSFTTDSTGSGAAHNNTQPTMVVNYIMRIV